LCGVKSNEKEALKWYKKAAIGGISHAHYNIGYMYLKGLTGPVNLDEALIWFLKEKDFAPSQIGIGMVYIEISTKIMLRPENVNKTKTPEEAKKYLDTSLSWFLKAAEQNYSPGQFMAGMFYLLGLNNE
jgi:hypothetical protein